MRRHTKCVVMAFTLLLLAGSMSSFGIRVSDGGLVADWIVMSETGHLSMSSPVGNYSTEGAQVIEPISGMNALSFDLPFPGIPGDIVLTTLNGDPTELARFNGDGKLYF